MSQTVIALYDDFDVARDVVEDLVEAGFARENISMVANDAAGTHSSYLEGGDDDVHSGEGAGFGAVVGALVGLGVALIPGIGPVLAAGPLAAAAMAGIGAAAGAVTGGAVAGLVDLGVPETEAGYFAEGVRRGGTLVSITTDDATVARAQDIMNRHNPVDLENRAAMWRDAGWTGYSTDVQPYTSTQIQTERQQYIAPSAQVRTVNPNEQARLEVVEEELRVGKRDVETGGVRVRSYVTSTPVQEQVNLREEHVRIERHPVNRPASPADLDAFQEGVIEVTEHAEEAVVSKTARVVEEVLVGKEASEHVETINDTVRRTDVEVEQLGTRTTRFQPYETYETRFRTHYNNNFANSGYTYEQYSPAYRHGYTLATNDQYRGYDWTRLEPEARRSWESNNPGTWENFKNAVRQAWLDITGQS